MGLDTNIKENNKISIIVPCRNVEKYVDRCLKSIEKQTIGMDNLEVVLIDDASEDNTRERLYSFEKRYPDQTILIACDENIKPAAARNIGVSYSTGSYITFIDSDDIVADVMLEKMYEKMQQYDCDMVECNYTEFEGDDGHFVSGYVGNLENRYYDFHNESDKKEYIFGNGAKSAVWGRLYKKEFLEKNGLSFIEKEDVLIEDVFYSGLGMLLYSNVYSTDEVYYFYYKNNKGITYASDKNLAKDVIFNLEQIFEELKNRNIYDEVMNKFHDEIEYYYICKGFIDIINMLINSDSKTLEEDIMLYRNNILKYFPDAASNQYLLKDERRAAIVDLLSD